MVIKRAGISIQNSLGIGCAQGAATFNGEALFIKSDTLYSDLQPFASGASWNADTAPAAPLAGGNFLSTPSLASLGGNLYQLGAQIQFDPNIYVHKSTDNGLTWTQISATYPLNALMLVQFSAVLNGTIFVTDGTSVYSTVDGITFLLRKSNIGATGNFIGMIVDGSILKAFYANGTNGSVWQSTDGVTWSSLTTTAGWGNRSGGAGGIWSYLGQLYILGGIISNTTVLQDVWKSTDGGVTWSSIAASTAIGLRSRGAYFTFNNKMWFMGGSDATGNVNGTHNDVWTSTDGITWTLVTAGAGWSIRSSMGFALHNNTFYIGFGKTAGGFYSTGPYHSSTGGAISTALTTPAQNCLPVQVALIPANGSIAAKAFIKSTKDAWVWDGATITKVSDADYPANTVYGVAYLDGTIYVMDSKGVIYGSDLLTPLSWNALNFITANAEADAGVAIARQLDNIIAFKETSIEFFYDAGNPTGSPLSRQPNALMEVGCASAGSIAYSDNTLFFMSQHKQRGRSVMKFVGTTPQQVSTPWVDRILDADDLVTIYSFVVRLNGHVFYFLTLKTSAITIVYDDIMNEWHTATKLTAFPDATVSTIAVQTDGSILVTMPLPHGSADGDPVTIAGATPSAANGLFNLRYDTSVHAATQFSYVPATAVSGSITGTVTATLYSSSYFPGAYYARSSTADLVLDEATGSVYKFSQATYQDVGLPIDVHIRTEREDFGTINPKSYHSLSIVGDNVSGNLAVRYSSNDYSTFSKYRLIDLSKRRPRLTQLGSGERRAWEFRYTGSTAFRLMAAEADVDGWQR
jgi:hypothetical protein